MNSRKDLSPELAALQDRLGALQGKKYWRTLEELADTEAFQELMRREFPEQADIWPSSLNRRQFLTLMGASLALAGLAGCSVRPARSINLTPYVRAPEEIVPGKPLFFATAMTLGGAAVGLLVESHQGRPTKIEGNPLPPASQGSTDAYHQASILTLYDPDRSQTVTYLGQTSTWDAALGQQPVKGTLPEGDLTNVRVNDRDSLGSALRKLRDRQGQGLHILTETVVSPTLAQQLHDLLQPADKTASAAQEQRKPLPKAKWHQYEPVSRDAVRRGADLALNRPVNTRYDFTKADVVVSLDADFLTCGPGSLRYVADFMSRRRVRTTEKDASQARMNRLYVVETSVTPTGAKADHRLALPGTAIEAFARALAAELKVPNHPPAPALPESVGTWMRHVAEDLRRLDPEPNKKRDQPRPPGTTVVVAGDRQPPAVHALAHAINHHLGNFGHTVLHTDPIEAWPPDGPADQLASLQKLVDAMDHNEVELLVILGGNPVFTAPTDWHFAESMQKVPLRAHLSLYQDETSRWCQWHLPEAHYLEAWSDARAFDGTAFIAQPLIEPLYGGRSAHEILSVLTNLLMVPGYDLVRSYWQQHAQGLKSPTQDFDTFWQISVHDGMVAGTPLVPRDDVALKTDWHQRLGTGASAARVGYELVFQPDPTIFDGRFANNGWLQELPKPITTLTWDNAALMSPATARELGIKLGAYAHGGEHGGYHMPVVELTRDGRRLRAPAWIMPGHADHCITVYLGYGRDNAGRVGGTTGNKVGFNAYALRTSEHPWFAPGLQVRKTEATYLLACTQQHQLMENRDVVRAATLAEYHTEPRFALAREKEREHEETERTRKPLTMYQPHPYPGHKWGMVIDLTTCTGCKACVVACQAENNIPVVGKDQVAAGREMHWLRIDRYSQGPYDAPREFYSQPVPCMHCENAPCEYVCPVEATVHSADGLNDMVYQRCVGTRFCSNNCPYKVRRFNFFHYADYATQSLRLQYNPDVTVRSRGVMEKCSYCVQRIRQADIGAQKEGRKIADGEILTACQAACPAEAIVFGDINDPQSKVKQWKESPLHYALLADLNTEPRTTYLAALRNPNPELEAR